MLCRKFKDKLKRKFKNSLNPMILLKKYNPQSKKIKKIKIKM